MEDEKLEGVDTGDGTGTLIVTFPKRLPSPSQPVVGGISVAGEGPGLGPGLEVGPRSGTWTRTGAGSGTEPGSGTGAGGGTTDAAASATTTTTASVTTTTSSATTTTASATTTTASATTTAASSLGRSKTESKEFEKKKDEGGSGSSSSSSSNSSTSTSGPTHPFHPLLLLLPVQTGLRHVDSEYVDAVRYLLSHPCCVGVVGGKPNSSYYFYATREDFVYFMNPHTTQPVVHADPPTRGGNRTGTPIPPPISPSPRGSVRYGQDMSGGGGSGIPSFQQSSFTPSLASSLLAGQQSGPGSPYTGKEMVGNFSTLTYHPHRHQKMAITSLDASMCYGFFFPAEKDWKDFNTEVRRLGPKMNLLTIQSTQPSYEEKDSGQYVV